MLHPVNTITVCYIQSHTITNNWLHVYQDDPHRNMNSIIQEKLLWNQRFTTDRTSEASEQCVVNDLNSMWWMIWTVCGEWSEQWVVNDLNSGWWMIWTVCGESFEVCNESSKQCGESSEMCVVNHLNSVLWIMWTVWWITDWPGTYSCPSWGTWGWPWWWSSRPCPRAPGFHWSPDWTSSSCCRPLKQQPNILCLKSTVSRRSLFSLAHCQ